MAARASFEDFYAATVDRLLGHLFLVTGDLHAAEEIVQEAFTRASMRWSRLRDKGGRQAGCRLPGPAWVPATPASSDVSRARGRRTAAGHAGRAR